MTTPFDPAAAKALVDSVLTQHDAAVSARLIAHHLQAALDEVERLKQDLAERDAEMRTIRTECVEYVLDGDDFDWVRAVILIRSWRERIAELEAARDTDHDNALRAVVRQLQSAKRSFESEPLRHEGLGKMKGYVVEGMHNAIGVVCNLIGNPAAPAAAERMIERQDAKIRELEEILLLKKDGYVDALIAAIDSQAIRIAELKIARDRAADAALERSKKAVTDTGVGHAGIDVDAKHEGARRMREAAIAAINALIGKPPEPPANEWDRQIEADSKAGKLDAMIAEAHAAYEAGLTTELPPAPSAAEQRCERLAALLREAKQYLLAIPREYLEEGLISRIEKELTACSST